ncbi:ACP S-malonyltransferase [Dongshaea marina]|uniref:ACP S-malonyltransferase n=1 Tax=Dongshaea marina TaxID=2047966 RepID=UPI000D3EBD83|nr:ACP S-malonyltransferase [Dongshaea marina]
MTQFAMVFPGQGSQTVGMLAELAENYDVVKQTFAEASEALGYDLWALVQNGPVEELNKTFQTQPALLTASVAIWRAWLQQGGAKPQLMAGHSLGEYSALVCAGVLDFQDAVKLVELRGKAMQEAVPAGTGAMAAIIGLDDATIIANCDKASQGDVVSAVNFNSPGQVVIAGSKEAVERASALMKESGAKRVMPLPVSVPSHCALMEPAAKKLADALVHVELKQPQIAVINNVDVAQPSSPEAIRDALVRQLHSPVRWSETVQAMADAGVETQVEMGPGKVLSGLVRRINKQLSALVANESTGLSDAIEKTGQ